MQFPCAKMPSKFGTLKLYNQGKSCNLETFKNLLLQYPGIIFGANDWSKYDPLIALLFARDNLPLTSPRRLFMRSSVQISSPHSAYAHTARHLATSLSRISVV